MIKINITQAQITELKNTKEIIVKNPDGIAKIYLSVTMRTIYLMPGGFNHP